MPPALIVALCTGPVTRPSNSPRRQAPAAACRAAITLPALSGAGMPKALVTRLGISIIASTPGAGDASGDVSESGVSVSGRSSAAAARRRLPPSPNTTRSASHSRCAARTHNSGPTPAGSPGTSASRGRDMSAAAGGRRWRRGGFCRLGRARTDTDVDIGFATHLAQVAVPLFLELALADALANAGATGLVSEVGLARAFTLHDMPTGLGLERGRDLLVLQRRDLGAEFRTIGVLGEPAKFAAGRRGADVVGVFRGDGGEIGTTGDARGKRVDLGLGGSVIDGVAGAHHDVTCLELGHHLRRCLRGIARLY